MVTVKRWARRLSNVIGFDDAPFTVYDSAPQTDGLFDDPTWGQSRGSRNKWKSYSKKSPWVTFTLADALSEVKAALLPLLRS